MPVHAGRLARARARTRPPQLSSTHLGDVCERQLGSGAEGRGLASNVDVCAALVHTHNSAHHLQRRGAQAGGENVPAAAAAGRDGAPPPPIVLTRSPTTWLSMLASISSSKRR